MENFENNFMIVWEEIFGNQVAPDYKSLIENFTHDLYGLPIPMPSFISDNTTYSFPPSQRIAELNELTEQRKHTNLMRPSKDIQSLDFIIQETQELNFKLGEKHLDSKGCAKSDNIYKSLNVYNSSFIFSSKEIAYSTQISNCSYTYFSNNNDDSSFSIRIKESASLNNCFEVGWSSKSSDCFYCYDVYDLRDCMFCYHIKSKQYCIGNMQYEKEEYFKYKALLLNELSKRNYVI